ncbi:MAG: prepilin peptidase [Lachnospiraceae bacterium]|nr:prepilin peptidase [Lachnospiraceae bacterium]
MADFWYIGHNAIVVIFVMLFLVGIVVGSFLNVLIFRIPLKEDIAVERSHCMHCGHILSWYELIPLFSWIIQGGKCRACKAKISVQYPIVEALNAILWMAVVWAWGLRWESVLFCICSSILIVLSVIDERTQEIPIGLNIAIAILGAVRIILKLTGVATATGPWYEYLIGAVCVSGLFLLIVLITKGRGMGGGDVKLMAAAGLLLGWKQIILAMMIGCVLGSVIHLLRMALDKKKKKEHVLAFGPYLAIGIYLTIIFGNPIIDWYSGFFTRV